MNSNKRQLGRTDIEITPIGLGVMQFAGGHGVQRVMFPEMDQQSMDDIVKAALEGGINWFDTAEFYGFGFSEQGLANALQAASKADEEVLIATKWNPLLRPARNLRRTIGNRQRFLHPYTIDLYQVHFPMPFSSTEAQMNAMADLVEAGKIRSVGVSNFDAERMRRANAVLAKRGFPLASNQVQYHLLHRQIETDGILDTAKELGITIIAWSPLGSGLLTGKFHRDPELLRKTPVGRRAMLRRQVESSRELITALDEIAGVHQVTTAQVALNWLINFHGDSVVAIPGASKVPHASESACAMGFSLTDAEMARIDELSRQFR